MSERKKSIDSLFDNIYFNLIYINDFDKEDLNKTDLNNIYENNTDIYEKKSEMWGDDSKYRELTNAEISCQLKHLKALEIISENKDEISLIIEDDLLPFKKNFSKKLKKIVAKKNDWDVLFIGQGVGKKFILDKINKKLRFIKQIHNVEHPATNCAESYLVKKDAAKKLSENFYPFSLPYDWELAYKLKSQNIKVKWLYPPIFFQGSISGKFKSENRIN